MLLRLRRNFFPSELLMCCSYGWSAVLYCTVWESSEVYCTVCTVEKRERVHAGRYSLFLSTDEITGGLIHSPRRIMIWDQSPLSVLIETGAFLAEPINPKNTSKSARKRSKYSSSCWGRFRAFFAEGMKISITSTFFVRTAVRPLRSPCGEDRSDKYFESSVVN